MVTFSKQHYINKAKSFQNGFEKQNKNKHIILVLVLLCRGALRGVGGAGVGAFDLSSSDSVHCDRFYEKDCRCPCKTGYVFGHGLSKSKKRDPSGFSAKYFIKPRNLFTDDTKQMIVVGVLSELSEN